MLDSFLEEGYTKHQVQRMAWFMRREGFVSTAKFVAEVAQLMNSDRASNT